MTTQTNEAPGGARLPASKSHSSARSVELDALLPEGHRARLLLDLVSTKEAIAKLSSIDASATPAHFALWLYAALKGVGSAEELAWLCRQNAGFRWLAGGLDCSSAALSKFRSTAPPAFDALLAEYLVAARLAFLPSAKVSSIVEGQLLSAYADSTKLVAQLRDKLALPLGEATKRRAAGAEQRKVARAAKVEVAHKGLQRLLAAQDAEIKRQTEGKKVAPAKPAVAAAPAKPRRSPESGAQVMVPGGYPVRPILGIEPMLPWSSSDGSDARFKRIQAGVAALFIAFSAVLMSYTPPPVPRDKVEKVPERLAKLLEEKKDEPKPEKIKVEEQPKPKDEKKEELKPADTPKPVDTPRPSPAKPSAEQLKAAREVAEQALGSGVKDQFAALRSLGTDSFKTEQIAAGAAGSGGGGGGGGSGLAERELIGKAGTGGSGGVAGKAIAYTGGGQLQGRSTTQVKGPQGAPTIAQVEKEARSGKRTAEDIKLAFDSNKSAIYALYRRALRDNPALEGRVVLKMTIDPSGKVTACSIVSSALKEPDLEQKIVARVMMITFGAKASTESWTGTYQIDFVPSS